MRCYICSLAILMALPSYAMDYKEDESCFKSHPQESQQKTVRTCLSSSAEKPFSRLTPDIKAQKLLPLFDQCCPYATQDINTYIEEIENFSPFDPKTIARGLIERVYDPVNIMCMIAKLKPELCQNQRTIKAADIIRHLFALGCEITKVPDYGLIAQKTDFMPLDYGMLSRTVPEIPAGIKLTTVAPQDFVLHDEKSCSLAISPTLLPNGSQFDSKGLGTLNDFIIQNLAYFCSETDFRALMYTSKRIHDALLQDVEKIPATCIPKKILDALPCQFIDASYMDTSALLNQLRDGFCKKWPCSGIAINFTGFNDPITCDLIHELSKYPIISICLQNNVLPDGLAPIGTLVQLRELWLKNLNIPELPQAICCLKELVALNIEHCGLTTLPQQIKQLRNLKFLDIRNNALTKLPDEIGFLTQLRSLIVSGNPLEAIPTSIGNLPELQNLVVGSLLSSGNIQQLPPTICILKKLAYLHCIKQKLIDIPANIGLLENLQSLKLSGNYLANLPDTMWAHLKNLTCLDLSHNSLTEIPRDIRLCEHLKNLDLSFNSIQYVPKILAQCSLCNFSIARNLPSTSFSLGLLALLAHKKLQSCFLVFEDHDDTLFLKQMGLLYSAIKKKLKADNSYLRKLTKSCRKDEDFIIEANTPSQADLYKDWDRQTWHIMWSILKFYNLQKVNTSFINHMTKILQSISEAKVLQNIDLLLNGNNVLKFA